MYEARLFPELGYTFKHALTHTVAYQSLLKSTHQQLHGRIASTMLERFPAIVVGISPRERRFGDRA
jgi:predicted ATPase